MVYNQTYIKAQYSSVRFLTTLAFIILSKITLPQEREKEAHYSYITFSTSVYTNAIGTLSQKLFMSTEVGRTFGIFDIGVSMGRLNLTSAKNGPDSNCLRK